MQYKAEILLNDGTTIVEIKEADNSSEVVDLIRAERPGEVKVVKTILYSEL